MQCPKDKTEALLDMVLAGDLPAKHCPVCEGNWILPEVYHQWRQGQTAQAIAPIPTDLDIGYEPPENDARAGLCPDCHGLLARARVGLNPPFYVERCSRCGGFWCDRHEWDALMHLGLHTDLGFLFSNEWLQLAREQEYFDRERRATIDKLGADLAQQVFDLAQKLEEHPNGDFGVAYLMRRFTE